MISSTRILPNIQALCKSNGITVTALERALSLGDGTIASWSKSSPSVAKLALVADYFGTTVDGLMEGAKE